MYVMYHCLDAVLDCAIKTIHSCLSQLLAVSVLLIHMWKREAGHQYTTLVAYTAGGG